MFEWLAELLAKAVLRKMIKLDLQGNRRSIPLNNDYPVRKQRFKKQDAEPKEPRCFSCNRPLYSYEHSDVLCRVCCREYGRHDSK